MMFFPAILAIVTLALLSSGHPTESGLNFVVFVRGVMLSHSGTNRRTAGNLDGEKHFRRDVDPSDTARPAAEVLLRRAVDPAEDGANVQMSYRRTAPDTETLLRRAIDPAGDGANKKMVFRHTAPDAGMLSRRIVDPAEDGADTQMSYRRSALTLDI
ncbi:hypothetical protein B0H11DRAFT_2260934 [Mycena galericulata]|nr:hypothetical protein B0H11DRAFT_2260934 [Mycena galericulata]